MLTSTESHSCATYQALDCDVTGHTSLTYQPLPITPYNVTGTAENADESDYRLPSAAVDCGYLQPVDTATSATFSYNLSRDTFAYEQPADTHELNSELHPPLNERSQNEEDRPPHRTSHRMRPALDNSEKAIHFNKLQALANNDRHSPLNKQTQNDRERTLHQPSRDNNERLISLNKRQALHNNERPPPLNKRPALTTSERPPLLSLQPTPGPAEVAPSLYMRPPICDADTPLSATSVEGGVLDKVRLPMRATSNASWTFATRR